MSEPILICRNVSIKYRTGDFKNIGLKEWFTRRLSGNYKVVDFWADRHVSFVLEKGDMLGIIGTNGAGKSTLLKVVSGIMEPSEGQVIRWGQIAALLELGSGFDGDLTVKENAYLRGAMLGYTRRFMDETYPSIIEFSGLKEFEDRPFKQLSSGMRSRLAFSIASLVKPEILILDEVLSVGDGSFKTKSEQKMREIIQGGATTILVSHSISQVRSLCNKVLWLDHGHQLAFSDDVDGVCERYGEFLQKGTDLSLLKGNEWSAALPEPRPFCLPGDPFQYSMLVKGADTLVFSIKARAEGVDAALLRAGLMRLRFSDWSGNPVPSSDFWTSTAFGGSFVYLHLDAEGTIDFRVRVPVPEGAAAMDVQFSTFKCKSAIELLEFSVKCGDEAAAYESGVHDPKELVKE